MEKYWKTHLQPFADGPNELHHLTQCGINKARYVIQYAISFYSLLLMLVRL